MSNSPTYGSTLLRAVSELPTWEQEDLLMVAERAKLPLWAAAVLLGVADDAELNIISV